MNEWAWKALLATFLVFVAIVAVVNAVAASEVCEALDSGKIDTAGEPLTVTITAPAGQVIDGYCVKAGSANSGDGPVFVTVDPPQSSVTIDYPGGKAVSHYSYSYIGIDQPTTTTTSTTSANPTTTSTQPPETSTTFPTITTPPPSLAPPTDTPVGGVATGGGSCADGCGFPWDIILPLGAAFIAILTLIGVGVYRLWNE
jgi:hypothetical protein